MQFNVRVYGLLINNEREVLLTDEQVEGYRFTKFPGGGVEFGEGMTQALKREFIEECNTEVEVLSHFYTTDFYVKSAFNDSQIIAVYYLVKPVNELNFTLKTTAFDFDGDGPALQCFRWKKLNELKPEDVTFPIDQYVVKLLNEQK
ncbi:NUDIX hydrolase [Mucilaginibacter terrae]|uniref:8-oxo-dGTP diphosphatase n=1 Tax=Mucilaginibacter terrae TaxID=1955052 RepID=A0ABU3H118_9SPHI|nr:NUDIX hydrolase [Mucilaginibacter terrae]MDT3404962.1 8-oxo-dGTP diphosphatase [Mucilaginibacter terrae]